MTFTIQTALGPLDLTPYIAHQGLKWSRNDIDGPNAGRDMTGTMHRDYLGTKYRFDVTCVPLSSTDLATILQAIAPEQVSLTYTDPATNADKTEPFYSNNFPATMYWSGNGGLWIGLTFPLIQL